MGKQVLLNENEVKVLTALFKSSHGNSHDFGFTDNLAVEGLSTNQIKGYVSALYAKGLFYYDRDDTSFVFHDVESVKALLNGSY